MSQSSAFTRPLSVPVTLSEKRKVWNANNYRYNRARILARKTKQRRMKGILSRKEWERNRWGNK